MKVVFLIVACSFVLTNFAADDLKILWDKSFGGSSDDLLHSLQQTSDGGFILGGWSSSTPGTGNKTSPQFGSRDFWLVRLDMNGNKLWEKSFGGDGSDALYSIQQTSDGGFILGGFSVSAAGTGNKTSMNFGNFSAADFWIVRLDSSGNKLWDKSFGGNDADYLFSIQQTSDGGFILGGSSGSAAGTGNKTSINFGSTDMMVVRLDSNGNKLWDKSFGGNDVDDLESLQQTSDGGFLLGGWSSSSPWTGNKTSPLNSPLYTDFWLVRLDANGNKLWDKSYGGTRNDRLLSLQQTADGGFMLGGFSDSTEGTGDRLSASFGGLDFWVVRVDSTGAKLWDKSFGAGGADQLNILQQISDGGLILGGISNSAGGTGNKTSANFGGYDFWVVRLGPGTPTILVDPEPVVVGVGGKATFSVLMSGQPSLSYQWLKDGKALINQTNATLTVSNVRTNDAGSYTVTVSNSSGSVTSNPATLTVIAPVPVQVTTIAGSGVEGYLDSNDPLQARFSSPDAPVVNRDGVIFIAGNHDHTIRFITPQGQVGTFAGIGDTPGYRDWAGSSALFNFPLGMNLDSSGDLLVTDTENNRIRRVLSIGLRSVSTIAGSGARGLLDSTNALAAQFNFPNDIAMDAAGNIYVSEFQNHTIRKIMPNGTVMTFAGNGTAGYADGTGTAARFNQPSGMNIAPDGNIYVAEWANNRIRKITSSGVVTTVAGTNVAGFRDGMGSAALLNFPNGIVGDKAGNLYICETYNHCVRKIYPGGFVQTIAGNGTPGYADGDGTVSRFNSPTGIALDPDGNLIVTDAGNQRIRKVTLNSVSPDRQAALLVMEVNATLMIYGKVGATYRIEYSDTQAATLTWVPIERITLSRSPELWIDPRPTTGLKRSYRAILD